MLVGSWIWLPPHPHGPSRTYWHTGLFCFDVCSCKWYSWCLGQAATGGNMIQHDCWHIPDFRSLTYNFRPGLMRITCRDSWWDSGHQPPCQVVAYSGGGIGDCGGLRCVACTGAHANWGSESYSGLWIQEPSTTKQLKHEFMVIHGLFIVSYEVFGSIVMLFELFHLATWGAQLTPKCRIQGQRPAAGGPFRMLFGDETWPVVAGGQPQLP